MNLTVLQKINLKNKIIAISAILPLTLAAIVYFVVFPTINDIKNIKNEIEAQRIDLEIKYQRGQSLKKLKENLNLIEPQVSSLSQIFIDQNKVLEFITEIEGVAEKNNISQKINLTSTNAVKSENHEKIPLQLITNGTFNNQLDYLIGLESLNYYININSLDIYSKSDRSTATDGSESEGYINMLIFADTFWQ